MFLSRIIGPDGVSVKPEYAHCVRVWPVSKLVKEVEQFLGIVHYHQEHIQGFAKLTSVLYKLTCSHATFY